MLARRRKIPPFTNGHGDKVSEDAVGVFVEADEFGGGP